MAGLENPVVWLLGFTFASNNSPYFVTSAFLGDYLATLGKPELLGAALGWLNGSQLVAMAVLFLTANRLQMRAWPFLVFGPTMLAAFLVMMIFVTSSLAIVAATAVIGIAGAVSMTAILGVGTLYPLAGWQPSRAAGRRFLFYGMTAALAAASARYGVSVAERLATDGRSGSPARAR